MNKKEYLLTCLSEECAEIQQAVSKALRFGLDNYDPKDSFINEAAIRWELNDLQAVKEMLVEEGILKAETNKESEYVRQCKKDKVKLFMNTSVDCGTLTLDK